MGTSQKFNVGLSVMVLYMNITNYFLFLWLATYDTGSQITFYWNILNLDFSTHTFHSEWKITQIVPYLFTNIIYLFMNTDCWEINEYINRWIR